MTTDNLSNKWDLKVNSLYQWRDEFVLVKRFLHGRVVLQRENGEEIVVQTSQFISERPVPTDIDPSIVRSEPSLLEGVSKKALQKTYAMQDHLETVMHGIDDPISPYDSTSTNVTERMKLKADELGIEVSNLWRLKKRYSRAGVYGLLDKRAIPLKRAERSSTDPLQQAIELVIQQTVHTSDRTNSYLHSRIKAILEEKPETADLIPSIATLNRMIAQAKRRLGLHGNAKQRQKADLTPKKTFGSFQATCPGQLVIFDSTKLDLFALDPILHRWIQVSLTLAYDFYSRSIVGWRFSPVDAKGVDASLVLFDVLHPKIALPDWDDSAYWNYFGVPDDIRIIGYVDELEATDQITKPSIAGIPFVQPDTVLIDHGKIYVSRTFQDVCARLGIHIQRARIGGATDKSPVENLFRQVSQSFCQRLPGYKGRDVASRGLDAEKNAFYYIEELDALFAEWVATYWQNHISRSLHYPVPGGVEDDVSPNDAYALGLMRTGFIRIPNLSYFDCLETEFRQVSSVGVTIQYLEYDSLELAPFRNTPSRITSGQYKGLYMIKADPRDRSQIFFFDEIQKTWIVVPWRNKHLFSQPFSDVALTYAKAIATERLHGQKPTNDTIRYALEDMFGRWAAKEFTTRREQRAASRDKILTQQASKDRRNKSKSVTLNTPPVEPPSQPEQIISTEIRGVFQRFDEVKSIYQESDDEF